jgi:hypothetical protein
MAAYIVAQLDVKNTGIRLRRDIIWHQPLSAMA